MDSDLHTTEGPVPLRTVLSVPNPGGRRWVAELSTDPVECLDRWAAGDLVTVPLGQVAVLRVGAAFGLRLLERLLAVPRPTPELAPVLYSRADASVRFLIPGGLGVLTAEFDTALFKVPPGRAHLPTVLTPGQQLLGLLDVVAEGELTCPVPGRELPGPDRGLPLRRGVYWLVEPDGTGKLWDPVSIVEDLARDLQYLWSLSEGPGPAAAPQPERGPNLVALASFVQARQELAAAS